MLQRWQWQTGPMTCKRWRLTNHRRQSNGCLVTDNRRKHTHTHVHTQTFILIPVDVIFLDILRRLSDISSGSLFFFFFSFFSNAWSIPADGHAFKLCLPSVSFPTRNHNYTLHLIFVVDVFKFCHVLSREIATVLRVHSTCQPYYCQPTSQTKHGICST